MWIDINDWIWFAGDVHVVCEELQVHLPHHHPPDQLHADVHGGDLCHWPDPGLPACFYLHQAVGHPST